MKICHVCKAECEDETELCPVCGADLTGGEEENSEEEIVINNPVLLATVDDVVSSEILKDLLKENGILFTCDSDEEGTLKVTFGGSFIADDIYVDESDFERAFMLLKPPRVNFVITASLPPQIQASRYPSFIFLKASPIA